MAEKQIKDLPEIALAAVNDVLVVQRNSDNQTSRLQVQNLLAATAQVIGDLQDVDDSGKLSGYILQYDGSDWVAVPNTGGGGSSVELFDTYADYVASGVKGDGDLAYVRDASGAPGLQAISGWAFYVYDSTEVTPQFLIGAEETQFYISQFGGSQESSGLGGIPAGTLIGTLTGKSNSELWDLALVAEILASVQTPKSILLTGPAAATVEVGTTLNPSLAAVFNPGVIENGDGSTGPNLVGNSTNFEYTLPDATVINRTPAGNSDAFTPPSVEVTFGNNVYSVVATHDAGTGSYTDNKGNIGTNLDPQRIAATESDDAPIVIGRYNAFFGSGGGGSTPVNSAQVRALTQQLLNASNEGTFDIVIPAGTPEVYFSVPAGKTITVLYVESSFADVTGTFVNNAFNVDDAGGNPVAYDNYGAVIGGGGFPAVATYRVTIS